MSSLPRNAMDCLVAFQSSDPLTSVMAALAIERYWPSKKEFFNALHKCNYTASDFGKSILKEGHAE